MFGGGKIKIDKDLLERAKRVADLAGFATVEEFVVYLIERELQEMAPDGGESDEEIKEKLKGLGYIS